VLPLENVGKELAAPAPPDPATVGAIVSGPTSNTGGGVGGTGNAPNVG
jgi:hypothetical protein